MEIAPPLTLTLLMSKPQLTGNSDGLGREGFVGLDEVDIVDGQAGLLHGLTGSGHGADAHDLRVDAALAPADELGHGLEVVLLHGLAGSEDDGGSAVVDAGGVTGGDALDVLLGIGFVDAGGLEGVDDLVLNALRADGERAAQLGKTLDGGTGAGELILLELDDLLLDLHGDGNDLIVETAGSFCAASVFCWEAAPKASSSSRVMPQTSQMFSAVVPMW